MSRLRLFLRCIGEAVCANGLKGLLSALPLGEALYEIAKDTRERLQRETNEQGQKDAIAAAARANAEEARRGAAAVIAELRERGELPPEAESPLALYLERVPSAVRQSLRRTEDPSGRTVPANAALSRPEQLAA